MSRSKRGKSNNDEFTNEQQSQLEAALQKESQLIDINASRRNEEQFIKFWNFFCFFLFPYLFQCIGRSNLHRPAPWNTFWHGRVARCGLTLRCCLQ